MAEHEVSEYERDVRLDDGRTLAYIDIGDPEGFPLVSNHGGLSSRLDVLPADDAAKAHGLRIIAPDRPGIGRSDNLKGRTIAGWSDDVRQLVDQLGIDRFAVMGWSFGGGYAQALGRYLADRVRLVVLVASVIPRDWEGMAADIDRMDRMLMKMSAHAGGRLADRTIFHLMHAEAAHLPKQFAKQGKFGAAGQDLTAAIAEGLSDTKGVLADYEIFAQPWGFDPSEITVATQIWQGAADELVPKDWGARLHDAIAGSTLTIVPDATHMLWYEHWDDIFDDIVRVTSAPS